VEIRILALYTMTGLEEEWEQKSQEYKKQRQDPASRMRRGKASQKHKGDGSVQEAEPRVRSQDGRSWAKGIVEGKRRKEKEDEAKAPPWQRD